MITTLKSTCLLVLLLGMSFSAHASSHTDGQLPGSSSTVVIGQPAVQEDAASVTDRSSCQSCCDTLQTGASRCVGAADSCCTRLEDLCFGKSDQSH